MRSLNKILLLSGALGVAAVGCGPTDAEVDARTPDAEEQEGLSALGGVPAPTRAVAAAHLARVRGSEMAPSWSEHAELSGPAVALYRPDIEGPAYYEVGVNEGGFIVVATGAHDVPVPHFDDRGVRPTEALAAQSSGRPIARYYKLDVLSYAAEDAAEELVAELGSNIAAQAEAPELGPGSLSSFAELKRTYASRFGAELSELRASAAEAWEEEQADASALTPRATDWKQGDKNLKLSSAWWIEGADILRDKIDFRQEKKGKCSSGCGPVAWAQLAVYADYMAEHGSAYYASMQAQKLHTGAPKGDLSFGPPARALVWDLNDALNTVCWGNKGSSTTRHGMERFEKWAHSKGAKKLAVDSKLLSKQEEHAESWLKARRPTVLGVGVLQHYVVAVAFGRIQNGAKWNRYVYSNHGWSGTSADGWIPLKAFYSATIKPR
jgi:hypothetical protein